MKGLKGKYFIDKIMSFALGNPEITYKWKQTIFELENEGNDVIVFSIPKRYTNESIFMIEKLLQDKIG